MKPFDLKAALAGAKVVTRDGKDVKIAGYNEEAKKNNWVLVGWVDGDPSWWYKSGDSILSEQSNFDLFMAPTEWKEFIVRDDTYGTGPVFYGPFDTLNEAEEFSLYRAGVSSIHEITIYE